MLRLLQAHTRLLHQTLQACVCLSFFSLLCCVIILYLNTVGVRGVVLHHGRYNLGLSPVRLLHMLPVFWLLLLSADVSGFSALVGVLGSKSSRAHLAFLRFFMLFTKKSNCRLILGVSGDATRTKYLGLAIKTDGTSG